MKDTLRSEILDTVFEVLPLLNKRIFKDAKKILKNKDITMAHLRLMFFLMKHGETTATNLGNILEVPKSNITVFVDKLVEIGFVNRINGKDRRSILLTLTDEGKNFLNEYMKDVKDSFNVKLNNFTDEDFLLLKDTMDNLTKLTKKMIKEDNEKCSEN